MKIQWFNHTLILNHRKLMDLPNKKLMFKELYKVPINFGKIELVKLRIKKLMLSSTMSLLVHFNIKDIIKIKLKKYSSMMSIRMITYLQTFLLLIQKKIWLKVKEDHKKDLMIIRGTMKKHQEDRIFPQFYRNKLQKRIARNQMKINVK